MTNSNLSRRTLAAGVAWTVPAVAAASAVPAFAASPEPGLNGWLLVTQSSDRFGRCQLTYDGRGDRVGDDGDPFGMYVWDVADRGEITSTPTITITTPFAVTWQSGNGSTAGGWSTPTLVSSSTGQYKYTSTYTGTYSTSNYAGKPSQDLDGRPVWIATAQDYCPRYTPLTLTRCAQIKGEDLCFDRSIAFGTPTRGDVRPYSAGREDTTQSVEDAGLESVAVEDAERSC